jgi:MFS family permease
MQANTKTVVRTRNERLLIMTRIVLLSFILFYNTITTTYLYSFLPEMMVALGMAETISDSGGYAAWLASAFFIGRFLSATYWGYFIDNYGRKRGLLLIMGSISTLSLLFGFSNSFYYALLIRFLTGLCNGLSIVGKTLSTEVCPDDFKAWSISVTNTIWALGGTVGPSIGAIFYKYSSNWPYLTSSVVVATIGYILTALSYTFFEETLPSMATTTAVKSKPDHEFQKLSNDAEQDIETESPSSPPIVQPPSFTALPKTEQLKFILDIPNISTLMSIFCMNTFFAALLGELIPFWVAAKYEDGGLDFNYKDISKVYFYLTIPQLILQVFLYPIIQKSMGDFWLLSVGHIIHIPMFFFLPFAHTFGTGSIWMQTGWIVFWLFVRNFASFMNFAALQRFTNDAITAEKRGKMNGFQITFSSCLQISAPFFGGWVLSWSLKPYRIYPFDYHFVFYLMCLVTCIALSLIYKLKFLDSARLKLRGETTG